VPRSPTRRRGARPQSRRYAALPPAQRVRTNAEADGALLDEIATPSRAASRSCSAAAERLRLSARGYHRVLRVAAPSPTSKAPPPSRATTSPRRSPPDAAHVSAGRGAGEAWQRRLGTTSRNRRPY